MKTKKNKVKINEIKKEKFIDKIYNNEYVLSIIVILSTIVLIVIVALLIASFTLWR